jgi:DNA-binding MarR family transcriptional regulator
VVSTKLQEHLDAGGLKHPCDLDLLLFFSRHPTAIMASEQIAAFAGYDLAQVARSLDVLVGAGVLRRSINPTHVGRLYSFTTEGGAGWLPWVLRVASTPDGRRQLVRLLRQQDSTRGTGMRPSQPVDLTPETLEGANNA